MADDSNTTISVDDDNYKEEDPIDNYKLKDRRCLCGLGAVQWYVCQFKCDSSHQAFTMYLIILLLTWGVYYMGFYTTHIGYAMLSGSLIGILMGFYAIPRVENLYNMRKSLQKLVKSNIKLRNSHNRLKHNVDSVKKANKKMNAIQGDMNQTNVKLKDAYKSFNDYGNKLNSRNVENIEQLKQLKYYFEECQANYRALLTRAEKSMLNALYREVQKMDGIPGLSLDEFKTFVKKLPSHYRRRFIPQEAVFRSYAGDDMNMDFKEFQIMINDMARKEALGQ